MYLPLKQRFAVTVADFGYLVLAFGYLSPPRIVDYLAFHFILLCLDVMKVIPKTRRANLIRYLLFWYYRWVYTSVVCVYQICFCCIINEGIGINTY